MGSVFVRRALVKQGWGDCLLWVLCNICQAWLTQLAELRLTGPVPCVPLSGSPPGFLLCVHLFYFYDVSKRAASSKNRLRQDAAGMSPASHLHLHLHSLLPLFLVTLALLGTLMTPLARITGEVFVAHPSSLPLFPSAFLRENERKQLFLWRAEQHVTSPCPWLE